MTKKFQRYSTQTQKEKMKRSNNIASQLCKQQNKTPPRLLRYRQGVKNVNPADIVEPFIVTKRRTIHNNMACPGMVAVLSKKGVLPEISKEIPENSRHCQFCYPK